MESSGHLQVLLGLRLSLWVHLTWLPFPSQARDVDAI